MAEEARSVVIYLRRSTLLQMLGLIGAFVAFILIAKYVAGNFDYGGSFGDINVGDDVVRGAWKWDASVTAKDLGYDIPDHGEARMDLQLNVRNIAEVKQKLDARGRYIKGSWDPADHRWGTRGGRIYSTAMALLALEAEFRFLQLYRVSR